MIRARAGAADLLEGRSALDVGTTMGLLVASAFVVGALGALTVHDAAQGIIAGGLLLCVGLATIDLGYLAVLVVPATLLMIRVGGALSVSDFVLFGAAIPAALLLVKDRLHDLRPLLWLGVLYQATLLPTLLLNPYTANYVEWFHEAVLVIGGLVVGWVVGWQGRARTALSAYVVGSCLIGIWAAVEAVASFAGDGSFQPVYLPYMHKNFIGNALAIAFVLAFARPSWARWSRRWSSVAMALCGVGILAAQSKQAMISVVVGVVFVILRSRGLRDGLGRRAKLMFAAAVPLSWFVWKAVRNQLSSGNEHSAANQRITWYAESMDIWAQSPVFGVGLRWWYTDRFGVSFQPPNAELEMLTSGGIVATVGFLVLYGGAFVALHAVDRRYSTIAMAIILVRFTQGQFDLFWVAGQAALPWLVAGIALGALALEQSKTVGWRDLSKPRHRAPKSRQLMSVR